MYMGMHPSSLMPYRTVLSLALVFFVREEFLSRYKCPNQIHTPIRDTTGFSVVIADIGIVMSKCLPVERQQAPEYVHRIQSMMSIAGSPVVLHQECYVCGQGCEEHPLATCPVCMVTAHPDCISERLCDVKFDFEPELLPGDVFKHGNVCCLCSACFDQNLSLFSPCNDMEALHSKVWDRMDKVASLKHSVTSCLVFDLPSFSFDICFLVLFW